MPTLTSPSPVAGAAANPATPILLRTLSLASIALARLIKTQYLLTPGEDPISELINQALEELQVEFHFNNSSNLQTPATIGWPPPQRIPEGTAPAGGRDDHPTLAHSQSPGKNGRSESG